MGTKASLKRARLVAGYIAEYEAENGIAPSLRELAGHFEVSVGTMQAALSAGLAEGILERRGTGKYRTIFATETIDTLNKKIKILESRRYSLRMSGGCFLSIGSVL